MEMLPWKIEWENSREERSEKREELRGMEGPEYRIQRVNQLDAGVFDTEIAGLLTSQALRCTAFFPAAIMAQWQPELEWLVQGGIFLLSIAQSGATYGHRLQNLVLRNEAVHGDLLAANKCRTDTLVPISTAQRI